MSIGWIKLHRSLKKWEWYTDVPTKTLFIELLIEANIEKGFFRGVEILPGQLATGRHALAKGSGLSEQNVRTSLERLRSSGDVTSKNYSKFSVITICNWNKYQETNQQINQHLTSNQPASNHNLRIKNKEERIVSSAEFEEFWNLYPRQRRGDKESANTAWAKALKKASDYEILTGLKSYAQSDEVKKGYAKGAAAWLNDSRWTHEYKQAQEKSYWNS